MKNVIALTPARFFKVHAEKWKCKFPLIQLHKLNKWKSFVLIQTAQSQLVSIILLQKAQLHVYNLQSINS
jgi:hypothetical protein